MRISGFDAMNDALEICSDLGFEMVPGFSSHWPMVSDTLIELGHAERVHEFATLYGARRQHLPMPSPVEAIDESNWRSALGEFTRATDWLTFFEYKLKETPWQSVLANWWPRLLPGMASGLTHGLIRTAHAIRSINRDENQPTWPQLRELAYGLGYWASLYVEQPGRHSLRGGVRLPEILSTIPRLSNDSGIGVRDLGLFHHMEQIDGWADAVGKLEPPTDIEAALSEVTLAFVQVNLAHDKAFPIPLIHTLTAPAALRMVLPHLSRELHAPSFVAVWEAITAILSSFSQHNAGEILVTMPLPEENVPTPQALRDLAAEHGDEHAVKFTEACLREHAIRPDDRFLIAPNRMLPRLRPYFR